MYKSTFHLSASMQKFQEQLRSHQPEIERITELADEILAACHPNAVRFVRYYLTITQTRWTQAVHRSDQRAVRLQDALRAARGSAALVDELLSWLTEAHALLTAKERDAVSDDLTVVESLLREHLVCTLAVHSDLSTDPRCTFAVLMDYGHFTYKTLAYSLDTSLNPLKPSGAKWLHLKASRAILV